MQQFGRVGRHAYIGGYTRLLTDALPFVKTVGMRPAVLGVNRIGLARKGFESERIRDLQRAFRIFLRSGMNTSQALERLAADFPGNAGRRLPDRLRAHGAPRRGQDAPRLRGEESSTED